jgi:PAS domain S-box-containing protein
MILHAAARVLGCGSVQLLLADAEKQALVFLTSITNRELSRLARVESSMGFALEGAQMPLAAKTSTMVRSYLEERLFVDDDVAALAGGMIPEEALAQIRVAIGPRAFASVPVPSRTGTLGLLLFEKPGGDFSAEDRDLLVAYADRVGADLESQVLSDEVERLETLDAKGHAPELYVTNGDMAVVAGRHKGAALWQAVGVSETALRDAVALADTAPVLLQKGERQVRLTLLRNADGGFIAACEDLTELEQLRREAARAREHLGKVLHSVEDVILTLDPDARIRAGNRAVRRALGYPPDELAGKSFLDLCADERSQKRVEELRPQVRSTGFAETELRLRHQRGRVLVAKVSALLLADDEERPTGVLVRIHDLTERRRGEAERSRLRERLLQTERLSALGEMAARIAHEVRNPLVSIGAAAQVVAEELPKDSPVAPEVQAIVRETRRLDGIITEFLRFARPPRVEKRTVDLGRVLNESVEVARAKSDKHELRVTIAPNSVARVDPDAIKQVLINLIFNAIEASPPGVIECEARPLDDGEWLELSVADHGPGIKPADRARVFDPFFSTKTRGTGLGLAVSKQIVDEHHGRIRLLNRRGGGSRVVIQLPIG